MPNPGARPTRVAISLAGIAFSAGLLASLPALAECVPENFPDNWLADQEEAGGHTIRKHVARTPEQMVIRYNTENVDVSTYADDNSATQHIQAALTQQRVAYNVWVEDDQNLVDDFKNVTTVTNAPVGSGISGVDRNVRPAEEDDVMDENNVYTSMRKSAGNNCVLWTSYPKP